MKLWMDRIAHVLLGLIFFVFGLNGFLNFIPAPEPTGTAAEFFGGLMAAGYFIPVLKIVEIVCGALILLRLFVPLALVVLAPVVVQIFLFHAFLDVPANLVLPIVLVALQAYLGFVVYKSSFAPLLRPKP